MTPRQLKHAASQRPVAARIVSDGCRDYFVELVSQRGAGLLRRTRGSTLKFRSLGEAHRLLDRCGVQEVVLRQRVADDEAADAEKTAGFHDIPITRH